MKFILILCCTLCMVACGTEEKAPTQAVTSTQTASSAPTKSESIPKKEACDYLSKEAIAQIMGWDAGNITSELSMSLKDRDVTVCNLKHGDDKLMIRLAWKSEKSAANKVLERNYETYLKKGEEELQYREINTAADVQTIFGTGKDRFGQGIYILRQRRGNTVDIQLEVVSMKAEEKTVLYQLQKIVANIGA